MVVSNLYEEAVTKWGKNHQLLVTAEEMSEAIAKIAQYTNRGRDVEEELICELADVSIMLEQCRVIYGQKLIDCIYKKLNKLQGHLND
jgi:predicted DNA-binding protein (UPF0278 family)